MELYDQLELSLWVKIFKILVSPLLTDLFLQQPQIPYLFQVTISGSAMTPISKENIYFDIEDCNKVTQ